MNPNAPSPDIAGPIQAVLGEGVVVDTYELTPIRLGSKSVALIDSVRFHEVLRKEFDDDYFPAVRPLPGEGHSYRYQMFRNNRELCGQSLPIQTRGEIPGDEWDALTSGVANLKERVARQQEEGPPVDPDILEYVQCFRLPDPDRELQLFRVVQDGRKKRLLVLWGCSATEKGAKTGNAVGPPIPSGEGGAVPPPVVSGQGGSRRIWPWLLPLYLLPLILLVLWLLWPRPDYDLNFSVTPRLVMEGGGVLADVGFHSDKPEKYRLQLDWGDENTEELVPESNKEGSDEAPEFRRELPHRYFSAGVYEVRLQLLHAKNGKQIAELTNLVEVDIDEGEVELDFEVSPRGLVAGTHVTASAGLFAHGKEEEFDLTLDWGDGDEEERVTLEDLERGVSHPFSEPGNYLVVLKARQTGRKATEERVRLLRVWRDGDSDGDHLPDEWERKYFGDLVQGPFGDPDQDGICNGTEWIDGSAPTKPNKRKVVIVMNRTDELGPEPVPPKPVPPKPVPLEPVPLEPVPPEPVPPEPVPPEPVPLEPVPLEPVPPEPVPPEPVPPEPVPLEPVPLEPVPPEPVPPEPVPPPRNVNVPHVAASLAGDDSERVFLAMKNLPAGAEITHWKVNGTTVSEGPRSTISQELEEGINRVQIFWKLRGGEDDFLNQSVTIRYRAVIE